MNMHIHIHTDSLCCAEEANNIIKQPYSNKKFLKTHKLSIACKEKMNKP